MSSLQALLTQLPQEADAKGKAFERLVKWFLENEPEYKALLKKVHHWSSSPHRWGRDTGIDLTAEAYDGTLWAIQAKAYAANYAVTKHDVDKFLSESGRRPRGRQPFAVRLLVATTDYLGANARAVLDDTPGARRLLLTDLQKASVSWPRTMADLRPVKTVPSSPKPHQRAAIRDVVKGFRGASHGQLLMACGTGKTLTALWSAEALGARRVLVLVPSLSLVRQTLGSWYANGKHAPPYKVVCSDESVHRGEDGDQLVTTTSELPYPITTDSRELAAFLRGTGYRYVFSTYHSSPVIAAAFASHRLSPFDLIIADEAHRVAGSPDAAFATVLDAAKIKAKRRLFMTATPRYATGRLIKEAKEADIEIASMDDESRFGAVFHKLSFADAIAGDLLTDYQVAVVVVDNETYREHVDRGTFVMLDGKKVDARTVACQLGLARGMQRFDLRKIVSFHSRVKWASSFAASFPSTVDLMPRAMRPSGELRCRHVSGLQSTKDRDTELTALKELDATTRGLLANARCLTEGIDVPALDGVAFIDPRRSEVDVVQAVGRAIRKSDKKKIGTIVIPVFVGERADAVEVLETSAFKPVWQVIQALRAHDDLLASQLDDLRREQGRRGTTGKLPSKISVIGAAEIGEEFLAAFDTRLVEATTANWEFWFGLLEEFIRREGHARVLQSHRTAEGFALGAWVNRQRTRDRSPERTARLEALAGWTWDPVHDDWEDGFRHLRQFVQRHGHARVPQKNVSTGFQLGGWVMIQRGLARRGTLHPDRKTRLESTPGWTWDPKTDDWETGFRHLQAFVSRHGHARVLPSHVTESKFRLGSWVRNQRTLAKRKTLTAARQQRLEALPDWTWDPQQDDWEEGFRQLQEFSRRKRNGNVPFTERTSDGFPLGQWVITQRAKMEKSAIPAYRIKLLESVKGWTWDPKADAWNNGFEKLRLFVRSEGHALVPRPHVTKDGFPLGRWVGKQRNRRVELEEERVRRLESVKGWTWDPNADAWERGFSQLVQFVHDEDHTLVPRTYMSKGGFRLGQWTRHQRNAKRKGLSADRVERLEALDGWTWDPRGRSSEQSSDVPPLRTPVV